MPALETALQQSRPRRVRVLARRSARRAGPQSAVSGRRSSGSQGESLRQSVQLRPGPNGSLSPIMMIMMITGIPGAGRRLTV